MKVAVTGASGFIGKYLTSALSEDGYDVLAIGRNSGRLNEISSHCSRVRTTDYSIGSLCESLNGVDAVVHLAGKLVKPEDDPTSLFPYLEPNVKYVENLFRAAAKVRIKKITFASSRCVYSPGEEVPFSEQNLAKPLNAYGLSKLLAEQYLELLAQRDRIKVSILRIATAYGFGERLTPVLMKFVESAKFRNKLVISGNKNFNIEHVYILDLVDAIIMTLGERNPGGVFNIGTGISHTLVEIAETVNEVFGNIGNLEITNTVSSEKTIKCCMDTHHTATSLGWKAKWSLRDGLEDFHKIWQNSC